MEYTLKELKIELTYKCPLSCIHCSSDAHELNTICMSREKSIEIITEASEMGLKDIAFSGGEPLIWEGIADVVELATRLSLTTSIYTSGNGTNVKETLKDLAGVGLQKAIFSLYSANKENHNRITRKRDSFDNTISAIKYANEFNIIPEIHFVALASNYIQLPQIVDSVAKLGVKKVSVLRFVPQGRGVMIQDQDTLSREQNIDLCKIIRQIKNTGFNIRTGSPYNVLLLNEDPKCLAAQDRLIIAPDLTIYPCDAFKQIKAGEIARPDEYSSLATKSLLECWNKSEYLNCVRKAIAEPLKGQCANCSSNMLCLSGCLAQKYLYHGTLDINRDPACLKVSEEG